MKNPPKMSEINFLEDKHYNLYVKGKSKQTWDVDLDWSRAANDDFPEEFKNDAIIVASLSAHVELIGMENAAELMLQATDFSLKIGLAQAVNDEARHAELFSRYAILANGSILDLSSTRELYLEHFQKLNSFDEVFLSHVFLENGALEQFNLFIQAFGEGSLIGQIYKGAMNDEARHVQMGINYFRQLISTNPLKHEMVEDHLNTFKRILHVNPEGIAWLSKISRIPGDDIERRVQARHDNFINKITEDK
ncbi:ferritin-like domain-containing protein [Rahnella aquatilis]|uniref:ferritin-like domain-containing protein n=1 Tax=Rahnella aquatilis TaxID=34038 RepID=UPI00365ADE4D